MLKVYTMYDNKAKIYNQPLCVLNEEELIESLKYSIYEGELGINPIEFDVFELGEYNPKDGKYELLEAPKHLFNLNSLTANKDEGEQDEQIA